MPVTHSDRIHMARALQLAAEGQGAVEPNPMVGCVIVQGDRVLGEGYHTRHGGPHAEIQALHACGSTADGATMVVTLEPCCHHGKTPPCTDAILRAGIRRVVVGHRDPFPQVAGGGISQLRQAGLEVEVGVLERQLLELNAPYLKLLYTGRPWVIAKWAMTLDGKIATRSGSSQWISGDASRARVHQLRGRVDAIMVGRGTAAADNPQLTARPPGKRTATRIVIDSSAQIELDSRLVSAAGKVPLLVACGPQASPQKCRQLEAAGCEVLVFDAAAPGTRLLQLLDELGRRRMTNVLVEGGGQLLGSLFDARAIDEVHVFVATKLVGGADARTPLAGWGIEDMTQAICLRVPAVEQVDDDIYVHGRLHDVPQRPE
jgi:diaminohydroxyphosphoribosylaminopyrimidine deaminase/5-amino-6-(5-phosphoribosylamino)uracil reductase